MREFVYVEVGMKYLLLTILACSQLAAADKMTDAFRANVRAAIFFNQGFQDKKTITTLEGKLVNPRDKQYLRSFGVKPVAPYGLRAIPMLDTLMIMKGGKLVLSAKIIELKPLTILVDGKSIKIDPANIVGTNKTASLSELLFPVAHADPSFEAAAILTKVRFVMAAGGYSNELDSGNLSKLLQSSFAAVNVGPGVKCGAQPTVDFSSGDFRFALTMGSVDGLDTLMFVDPNGKTCLISDPVPCNLSPDSQAIWAGMEAELNVRKRNAADDIYQQLATKYSLTDAQVRDYISSIECSNKCSIVYNDEKSLFTGGQVREINAWVSTYRTPNITEIANRYASMTSTGVGAVAETSNSCRSQALDKLNTDIIPEGAPAPTGQ
jgi:hypothetical protein